MIRSKALIGRTVVDRMSGRRLGRVAAVDYRPGERWLRGLTVETAGLRRRRRYLRRSDIALMGENVILCSGPLRVLPAQKPPDDRVYTPDGRLWGRIGCLEIDPLTGQVSHAQVHISLLEDLAQGCRRVDASGELAVRGDRVLYCPPQEQP